MLFDPLSFWRRSFCIVGGLLILLLGWKLALVVGLVSPLLLPPPSKVGVALTKLVCSVSFWNDLLATTFTWFAGVALGTLIGGFAGVALGLNRYVWVAIEPWVEFLRSLPSVVLVPLVSLFLGVGSSSRVACSAIVILVLMVSSSATAVRATKDAHMRLASAWRATRFQTIWTFVLPAVLSHMVIALRAGIPIALIVTVAADMLIATESGIGKIIMDALAVFDMARMYAAVFVVGLLGYMAAAVSDFVGRLTIHWSGA